MKKGIVIVCITIFFAAIFCPNVKAYTSGHASNLKEVVEDTTGNLYKETDQLNITPEDAVYLDSVDFSKFENITSIYITDCYNLDLNKLVPNKKVNLNISNSVLDFSNLDFSKFNQILTNYTYDISSKLVANNLHAINSEYEIDKEYDEQINKIAKEIYAKSENIEDIIKNVTLYVVNNIAYDGYNTYTSLPIAESIFKHKMGVCSHYAWLESQLLNKLGIFTINVGGYTSPEYPDITTHGWVIAYINNEWYGIDPTWIDEDGKTFDDIEDNEEFYMIKLSDTNSNFAQTHYSYFTLYDSIPINNRVSKMSIINNTNENNTNNEAQIVEVEDTGMNISDISKIIGIVLMSTGICVFFIIYYLNKNKNDKRISD